MPTDQPTSSEPVAHMASSSTPLDAGMPIVSEGTASLGPLSFTCDGTIAGQVWGAGAALGRHLLQFGLPNRPDVVEIGSGTGVAGLAPCFLQRHKHTRDHTSSMVLRCPATKHQIQERGSTSPRSSLLELTAVSER